MKLITPSESIVPTTREWKNMQYGDQKGGYQSNSATFERK